nr:hypothetical protein [Tanacetum cinerariifolium]
MVAASKVSMLKPGEYEIWRMRIEQYIQMIDYALWEVIKNDATLPKTQVVEGVTTYMPITTAEEKAQRRLEHSQKNHGCGYSKWKDEITFGNTISFLGPTTPSNSSSRASSSSKSSRAALSLAKEHRNVRLGLAADSFNPFGNLSQSYSMWPVILTTYNTPPWICMKESSFMLTCLIPGPKSPSKDMDVYLQPLVKELKTLWKKPGVKTLDVATYTTKTKKLISAKILKQLADVPSRILSKHPSYGGVKRQRDPIVEKNWSKQSIFYELPYWSSLPLKHNLDAMHIQKNILESLLGTLLMNDLSKDTNKARQDLEQLNIRPKLWLNKKGNGKFIKPHAAYSFPPEKRRKFCEFIKGVKLPDGFGSNFKPKVTDNDNNLIGMKSHDSHLMMQRLLPAGAQAYLDSSIATPIIKLCSFFKQICARSIKESDMLIAEDQLVHTLCNFERIYPPAFFNIMIHGHAFTRRGYSRPEGCIAEGYIAEEALTFCSHYLQNVPTRFNRKKLDDEVKKKLVCYVLDNSPEIDECKTECRLAMPANDLPTKFSLWFRDKKENQYILATQTRQVFYLEDPSRSHHWKVFQEVNHRKIWDKDVIVDADVVHDNNSSDVALTANLDDLEYTRLSGAGPSTKVSFIPTSRVNDDDDFIDDDVEYVVVHVLSSDSEDEDSD